jgi:hypothetical protein
VLISNASASAEAVRESDVNVYSSAEVVQAEFLAAVRTLAINDYSLFSPQ